MKAKILRILLLTYLFLLPFKVGASEYYRFTGKNGSMIKAKIVEIHKDSVVTIQRSDGKILRIILLIEMFNISKT